MDRRFPWSGVVVGLLGAWLPGCTSDTADYFTEEIFGNINVQIVNNTPYRASFTFGTYNDLDRNGPGPVDVRQRRLEAHGVTEVIDVFCRRELAIGTQALVDRILATDSDETEDFDRDAFSDRVNFSSAPADDPAAALPTVGTANGVLTRLGVDFACNDTIIFTLQEDPNAPGGFRIDYILLHSAEPN